MHLGNKRLEYNLYLDPTGVSIWGDGSGGSQVYITSNPPNGAPVNLTVYGRIQARQGAPAGMYRDNVFVVIDPATVRSPADRRPASIGGRFALIVAGVYS